ncbi:MAG: hypothetical protein A3G45_02635 [Candidatus Staskawiczbacteria bacterium RIFCSPLOWO2_12_FULL_37_15]|uniref:SspI n=1 Tax=Candidatus Staskawiczbacteria bacterium RIFCSPLOWO2_12_FULL_37_15 TaxID=1802218 RepID=A0A1G2ISI9_9BACT|nr:MAG: SspI [Parcubacteria group bacterium GW2011_GWA2_37_10]OGZ77088.1 MAG: hypothetical protein A3G45_02635 [Candidatus Staskawiczbacteria bacterium RIFCSPLOWO2_12_FULL_37_15]
MNNYEEFLERFKLLASKNQNIVINTLSNIFTMRLIGNKTHGDLAEIGIAEFIKQFMYDYDSIHVGKDLFRAKEHEEYIMIINEITKEKFPISLKAYGNGPLQCEVRYGGAPANALQRGLWTHTKNAVSYFDSLTNGWIKYSHNKTLVKLFSLALNSTEDGHKSANEILQKDIDKLKNNFNQ